MGMDGNKGVPLSAADLVAHAGWLRRLAGHLVSDEGSADDVVQDTYIAALRSPPDATRPPRPWLAQVLRNTWRSSRRGTRRRHHHEQAAGALAGEEQPPSADEVLARTELQQLIAELLTKLEEPYRATLLLRYFEERDASEIAALYGIPAGTVRWRINEGVRRLRERLDSAHEGRRQRWSVLLAPLARTPEPKPLAAGPAKLALVGGVVAAAGLTAGLLLTAQPARPPLLPAGTTELARTPVNPNQKESEMTNETRRRMGALMGVALPALVAGGQAAAGPGVDPAFLAAAADHCVQMREKVYECKDAFAESFVNRHKPTPEQRAALLARAYEEIVADGSGPLEPRKKACEATVNKMLKAEEPEILNRKLEGMKKLLAFCAAKTDCNERVECMVPFFPPGKGETAAPPPGKAKPPAKR
jgi:RNA polymerase sigma factor (sigma-70 family)